jgi:hypothetical protein
MSGNRVKTHAPWAARYLGLGLAVILATATLALVSPSGAYAAPSAAYVQGRATQVTSGTTASLAFSKANTAGNMIVVYLVWDNPGTVTLSDTRGNTYTPATTRQAWGQNWSAQVFYASNIAAGTNTVKATFGTAISSFGLLYLHEYSGLVQGAPVDGSASAVGTSGSMSSGAVSTTQANDLLFAAGVSDITVTKGSGFTARLTNFGNLTEDRSVTTTGSYAGTASQSGTTWAMQLVAFRVASGTLGPPAKLAFVQGPSNTAAGASISPAVTVAVEDANNNIVTSDSTDVVNLAFGSNPAGGTLAGTSSVTVNQGVATFAGLSINKAGTGYTLTASSGSLASATSGTFNIIPGTVTKLVFVQGPSNAVAGATITPAVKVAVEDANSNIETTDNATQVSLAIGTNPANGALTGGGPPPVTVASGIATFSGLSINNAGTGYTLTASSGSLTTATSGTFNITPGTATKLAFVQGPSNAVAGANITPAVTVAVEDASGNIVTSDSTDQVNLAIGTNPANGTLTGGGPPPVTVASGIATFSGLSINKAGTGYTLTASSGSLTTGTSGTFNITPGTATKLAFLHGPANTAAGATITPAVTVAVEDANNNIVTTDSTDQVNLAIGTNPANGTLTGTTTVTVNQGVATFSDLAINNAGTGYTLAATSSSSYTAATSAAFNVSAGLGPATQLVFLQPPSNTSAGATITPAVTVAVEDANGNIETTDNATQVSLAIGTNPASGTLTGGGPPPVTVASGIATFSGLSINKAGTGYTLTASSGSLTSATSGTFNITPGTATKLAYLQSPSNTAAGATITPAVTVAVEDANGNIETTDNATQVSLAIGTNPASGTLTGGGPPPVTVASGIATFSGLSINKVGTGYTLTATASSYSPATSAAFNITLGAATKLAFLQGPSNAVAGANITPAVKVAVEDANGNIETTDNATQVSLAIGTNPASGTLTGGGPPPVTVASGIATFSGLSINNAGTGYTLTASSNPSYAAATSAAFNITATTTSSDWTSYLQGIDRTGYASAASGFTPASAATLQLAWKASDTSPHGVFAQPVVANGLVYWGSFDGYERATNTSGTLVWQTNLGVTNTPACTDPASAGISGSPTITTDVPVGTATSVMYEAGGNSKVYALNAATGAVLWSYDVGGNPNTFLWDSPAVFGNSVYIGVSSFGDCPLVQGQIVQLNRVTGALQHIFDIVPNGCTGGGVWGSISVDAAAGTLYFATGTPGDCPSTLGGPAIMELRASDLSLLGTWTVPLGQQLADPDFGSTPTLFTGVIGGQSVPLVGAINKNGLFYALKRDALSAGPVWTTRIATGGGNPTTGAGDQASAAFDGTTLYVGGDNKAGCSGSVNALNPSTGAFIWQHCYTDGGWVMGGVTVTSGGVVAVGEGNNISLVSAANGASVFTYTGVGPFWGPPSVAGGSLYGADMSGNLYALTPGQTGGAAQFVQVNSATPQTNQSTVAVPYTKSQAAGDLNAVAIGFDDSTSTITSVTDNAGNVYQVAAPLKRGSGVSQAIYYAKNIKAAAAGNAVTVQFSGAVPYVDVRVAEYAGLDQVNPLDTTASTAGSGGSSASSGNLTTSAANEVLFGAGYTTSLFGAGTNGFISRIITSPDGDIAGDKFVGTAGAYAATAGVGGGIWVMQAVAFRGAS